VLTRTHADLLEQMAKHGPVDLLRAYSKRSDLLFELVSAVEHLQVEWPNG
jgi:hypothetical protein